MQGVSAKVTESGVLQLPPEILKALGLDGGGKVVIELHGREIRVRTQEDVVARAQELTREIFKGQKMPTVDEFLAERRREAERE